MAVINLENITIGYESRILLENINLTFGQGELTALIGRNGTGKSTLMRTITGLSKPLKGNIYIDKQTTQNISSKKIASLISLVSTEEIKIGNLTVYDLVGIGRAPYTNWIGKLSAKDKNMVDNALSLVGMKEFRNKNIDSLSDGERQRVMIARAIAQDTPVILLDEPTAFLDLPNKYEIMLLLKSLAHDCNKTIIVSTHDLTIALELCNRILIINDKNMISGKPMELVDNGNIQSIFKGTSLYYDPVKGVSKK